MLGDELVRVAKAYRAMEAILGDVVVAITTNTCKYESDGYSVKAEGRSAKWLAVWDADTRDWEVLVKLPRE